MASARHELQCGRRGAKADVTLYADCDIFATFGSPGVNTRKRYVPHDENCPVRRSVRFLFLLRSAATGSIQDFRRFSAKTRGSGNAHASRGNDSSRPADGGESGPAADGPLAADEALQRAGAEYRGDRQLQNGL